MNALNVNDSSHKHDVLVTLFSLLSHSPNYSRLCDASSTLQSYSCNSQRYNTFTIKLLTYITYTIFLKFVQRYTCFPPVSLFGCTVNETQISCENQFTCHDSGINLEFNARISLVQRPPVVFETNSTGLG